MPADGVTLLPASFLKLKIDIKKSKTTKTLK